MEQVKESLSVLLISANDTLGLILWCVFIGVVISFVSVFGKNRKTRKLIETLLEKEAVSPEKALVLPEKSIPSSAFKGKERLFALVEKEEGKGIYIPFRNVEKAEAYLKVAKTPLWLAFLELVAFYALLFIISKVLPLILEGFSNL